MHYDAIANDHGLRHDPFKALVAPRPIGWISTVSRDGAVNLAPYSFFNAVGTNPHYVMFGSGGRKDSMRNAEETGEFVCSLATYDLRREVHATGVTAPPGVDEMALVGLEAAPSRFVRPPRVKASPVALECKYHQTIELPGAGAQKGGYFMILGLVVGVYIAEEAISEGIVDVRKLRPIARLGYADYAVIDDVFEMQR
ncbi:MAG: flavin reductase family protein [Hyphomicrobiales bacterium]|nr:flavin reductase family protein [Hyphomicrobiales bacterium]